MKGPTPAAAAAAAALDRALCSSLIAQHVQHRAALKCMPVNDAERLAGSYLDTPFGQTQGFAPLMMLQLSTFVGHLAGPSRSSTFWLLLLLLPCPSGAVTFKFRSGALAARAGMYMRLEVMTPQPCMGNIFELDHTAATTNSSGWISSELSLQGLYNISAPAEDPAGWLTGYAPWDTCLWLVKAPPKALVHIEDIYLDLDQKANVSDGKQDRVEVFADATTPVQTWVGSQRGLAQDLQLGASGMSGICWSILRTHHASLTLMPDNRLSYVHAASYTSSLAATSLCWLPFNSMLPAPKDPGEWCIAAG